jgi:hypothetical protein
LHLALGLPPLSSPEMDLFFRKQIAFLEAIFLSREQTTDISVCAADDLLWPYSNFALDRTRGRHPLDYGPVIYACNGQSLD